MISLLKNERDSKAAENEKIVGLGFTANISRSYPFGNFASQFIGIARPKDENGTQALKGDMGLEKAFNNVLSGENGKETYQKISMVAQFQEQLKSLNLLKMVKTFILHLMHNFKEILKDIWTRRLRILEHNNFQEL